jgi:hypothetical protein
MTMVVLCSWNDRLFMEDGARKRNRLWDTLGMRAGTDIDPQPEITRMRERRRAKRDMVRSAFVPKGEGIEMPTIAGIFCRICGSGGKVDAPQGESARTSPAELGRSDDLTEIRGIGITMQNNLHRAGIKTFAALAAATPEQIRDVLGARAKGAQVEEWISQAATLCKTS